MKRIIWNFLKSYLYKKKKRFWAKNPQTVLIILKLKAIHSIQQYFQSLVFLFFLCFLVLESRCNNLSKTFSGILSNRPLKPIYNPSIFAWLTSALRVSAFNSLENCFQLFNMIFLSDYILFTTLVSTIAFSPCFGNSKSSTLLAKTFHDVFVDSLLFLILL